MLNVLRERRDPQFVVFLKESGELLMVCVIVGDFACLSDNAGALSLEFSFA